MAGHSGSDETSRSLLRGALDRLKVRVQLTSTPAADPDLDEHPSAARWSATATVWVASLEEDEGREGAETATRLWTDPAAALQVVTHDDGDRTLTVARCNGIVIDLYDPPTPGELFDLLDSHPGYADFLPLALEPVGTTLNADFEARFEWNPRRLVILDRVEIAPAWRGQGGIGRLVVATALRWMATEATAAVLRPFPLEYAGKADQPGFATARKNVRAVWGRLGFEPWREEIWYRECSPAALAADVEALREQLGV